MGVSNQIIIIIINILNLSLSKDIIKFERIEEENKYNLTKFIFRKILWILSAKKKNPITFKIPNSLLTAKHKNDSCLSSFRQRYQTGISTSRAAAKRVK